MSHGIDEISRPSSAWRLAQGIGLRFFRLEGACKRTQFRVSTRSSLLWVLCRVRSVAEPERREAANPQRSWM